MSRTISVEDYSLLFAQDLFRVLPLLRLTGTQRDVWDTMLEHLAHGNRVTMTRREIAHRLQIDPSYVSRATKRLSEVGLIWRRTSSTSWYVNPRIAFKGSPEGWVEALADLVGVPEIQVPDYQVRPPRRSPSNRLRSVPA